MPDDGDTKDMTAFEAGDVKLKIVGDAGGGLSPEQARQYLSKTVRATGPAIRRTLTTEEVASA